MGLGWWLPHFKCLEFSCVTWWCWTRFRTKTCWNPLEARSLAGRLESSWWGQVPGRRGGIQNAVRGRWPGGLALAVGAFLGQHCPPPLEVVGAPDGGVLEEDTLYQMQEWGASKGRVAGWPAVTSRRAAETVLGGLGLQEEECLLLCSGFLLFFPWGGVCLFS